MIVLSGYTKPISPSSSSLPQHTNRQKQKTHISMIRMQHAPILSKDEHHIVLRVHRMHERDRRRVRALRGRVRTLEVEEPAPPHRARSVNGAIRVYARCREREGRGDAPPLILRLVLQPTRKEDVTNHNATPQARRHARRREVEPRRAPHHIHLLPAICAPDQSAGASAGPLVVGSG